MVKILDFTKKAFTNPAILYVISRYGTYIIQFVNSLFIAVSLGPYYLGIWGFINLVIGYIGQLNLGISHSVNVIISLEKQNDQYVKKIIGNGITMIFLLSLIVILFLMIGKFGLIELGNRYDFSKYTIPVTIIALLTHINGYFANIFRVFGKIHAIAINQSLYPVIVLFLIPFFKGEKLLWAMLYANSAAFVFSFMIYIIKVPVKIKPIFEWKIVKYIQIKGWHLFIYNTSFHLILLSTKSFISGNYEVKEFGYFTFSYTLANVVLLLLNSVSFLIFPKLLNRFANSANEHIIKILSSVRSAYISLSHLLIHFIIMLFPLFLLFFPDYNTSSYVFKFTALTVVLYTNSFGYQGLLMAKGKEKLIALIAFSALILNIAIAALLVFLLKVPFSMVILSTMLCYLIYVYIIGLYGRGILGLKTNFFSVLKDVYPWRMMLAFILSLILSLLEVPEIYFTIPFVIYIIFNYSDVLKVKDVLLRVIKNPNFINI